MFRHHALLVNPNLPNFTQAPSCFSSERKGTAYILYIHIRARVRVHSHFLSFDQKQAKVGKSININNVHTKLINKSSITEDKLVF